MKKVRILACVVIALMLAIGMMACSSKDSTETTPPAEDTGGMADRETEDTGGMADREDGDTSGEEQTVTGTITDASMNTLTIKTDAGDELSFSTEDADTSNADGLEVGTSITVYYTGTINGTDTSGATVVAIQK